MKHLSIIILCILSTMTMLVYAQQEGLHSDYVAYDLNDDGMLAANDSEVIYNYIIGPSSDISLSCVDLNKDGVVNTIDVVTLYLVLQRYEQGTKGEGSDPTITNPDMEWGAQGKRRNKKLN